MATLRRSADHSIWFSHITDEEGSTIAALRGLLPEQSVLLRIGNREGIWQRFRKGQNPQTPEGLRCFDQRAKDIWNSTPCDGSFLEIAVVRVELTETLPSPKIARRASKSQLKQKPQFVSAGKPIEGNVVCIGIDIAWWGGLANSAASRTECIAVCARQDGNWSDLKIHRVDLTKRDNPGADDFTPNADPDAGLLIESIRNVLSKYSTIPNVVIAADAPMMAYPRPGLSKPQKPKSRSAENKQAFGEYRMCDKSWQIERAKSPRGWRNIQILPGAPLYPRIVSLVQELLLSDGFKLYQHPDSPRSPRCLIECFPNEVLWSTGVLGYAEGLTEASIRAYKRIGKSGVRLPKDVFLKLCRHTLYPAFHAAEIEPRLCDDWFSAFEVQLRSDKVLTDEPAEGRTGKSFDDCVDSVLSLVAGVAFAKGIAHVHQGNDTADGHIIGPGIPKLTLSAE